MKSLYIGIKKISGLLESEDKRKYTFLLIMMLIGAGLDVIGIGIIPAFISTLTDPDLLQDYPLLPDMIRHFGIEPGAEMLIWGSFLLMLIFLIKNTFLSWMFYYQSKLVASQRVKLADKLFSTYMKSPYSYMSSQNTATILRNTHIETMQINQNVILPMLSAIMGLIMSVFTVALMVVVAPWEALVGIFFIGIASGVFMKLVKSRLERYGSIAKDERMESVKAINQGLGAFVDAKLLSKETYFIGVLRNSLERFANVDVLSQSINRVAPFLMETISVGGLLFIIFILSIVKGMSLVEIIPLLAFFGVATIRFKQTISEVVRGIGMVQYNMPSIENVEEDLFYLEGLLKEENNLPEIYVTFENSLVLRNISFNYDESDRAAISEINITLNKGESVGFVGTTGSGKSTLINMLMGLLPPKKGEILVDGFSIYHNKTNWKDLIGYIPQTIYLIDDSIKNNIALGVPENEIDEDNLWHAIRVAQLENYIKELPDGLSTSTGERGVKLSGGQRQRIGLARALYKKPKILVMDEATSALDNQTEKLVMHALESLTDVTLIMIAHRLSTVEKCDKLYLLEHGRIIGNGNFNELMSKHEFFQV